MTELLRVEHISVQYPSDAYRAVNDVSFSLQRGRVLGIVGESGCGKSTLIKRITGILPSDVPTDGRVLFQGTDLNAISEEQKRSLLGNEMGVIVQDSISSLNPIRRIRTQFIELFREKLHVGREEALARAANLLQQMHCNRDVLNRYPFQLSGGQRQRVMIAMSFALQPSLLIADEPTTALDVTVQAEILREILQMKRESETGVIFISHNLGVIAQVADEIAVMLHGKLVEYGSREAILQHSEHPYTQELIRCIPAIGRVRADYLHSMSRMISGEASAEDAGCPFAQRCAYRTDVCLREMPACQEKREEFGYTRCHLLSTEM